MGPGHWGVWGRVRADPSFHGETYESTGARRARHVVIAACCLALVPLNYWAIVTFDAIWAVTAPAPGRGRPELGAGGWLWIIVILGLNCLPLLTIFAALWAGGPDLPAGDAVPVVTAALMCLLTFIVLAGAWDGQLRLDALTTAQLGDAHNALAACLALAVVTLVAALVRAALDATAD